MAAFLAPSELWAAEIGSRLLIVKIHDLCRFARGFVDVRQRAAWEGGAGMAFSEWFALNTIEASRALDITRESSAAARFANESADAAKQRLAIAVTSRLSMIEYRMHYQYATAIEAIPEIAFDAAMAYANHRIADWENEPEADRMADCKKFRAWVDANLSPPFLWNLYQRIERERNAYLAWATDQGEAIEYNVLSFTEIPREMAVALNISTNTLLLGKAELRGDVDEWAQTQTAATDNEQNSSAGATVNARMIDTLYRDNEARNWTARQWGVHLNCAPSTVVNQAAWKQCAREREAAKLDRRE